VISQLAGSGFEQYSRLIGEQSRQWILAATRRFEDVAALDLAAAEIAGFAGNAKLVLGAIVVRLEIGVAHRPVG